MLTIIFSTGGDGPPVPLTKTLTWTGDGWSKSSYGNAYLFHTACYPVGSIDELSLVAQAIESKPTAAIIRGRLVDGRDDVNIRRTLRTPASPKGNFEAVPGGVPWVMLDIDKLPVASLGLTTNEDRLNHLISLLPPEFADVTYHYQWSSSAGLAGWDFLSCHLFFFLSEPWPCRTLYERFDHGDWQACEVDPAPFTPNQIHYMAAPQFIGAPDPLGCDRSGLVRRNHDTVTISPWVRDIAPPPLFTPAEREQRFSGAGFAELLGDIGPNYHRPILRAVAHYIAVTAEPDIAWLIDQLTDAIWAAPYGKNNKNDYLDRRYLDRVIAGAVSKFGGHC
jgi:hypothetical protein